MDARGWMWSWSVVELYRRITRKIPMMAPTNRKYMVRKVRRKAVSFIMMMVMISCGC